MRSLLILIAFCLVSGLAPELAAAQTGSGSAAAGAPAETPPPAPQALKIQVPEPTPAELRQICAEAMNKNPGFSDDIVKTINEETYLQHARAADSVKKNEKHVVMAYAAMWVLAALFLIFLWRRQQGLKTEIANLKRDLEAAAK
jgi:hypothetical protein